MAIFTELKTKYADYRLNKINKLENSITNQIGSIKAAPTSPNKVMPDKLEITLKTLPKQLSIAKNMENTVKTLKHNPSDPKSTAKSEFIRKFEDYAHSIGMDKVSYSKVPQELIFKDKSILFDNAIILISEMDKNSVDMAPSPQTQEMGIVTYDDHGKKTNQLAEFLRERGYASHASHPAGGVVIYTWLAQNAGLGHVGKHGMLITPEFGPRQRISAIFTSINNLPIEESDNHSWIPNFCEKCKRCINNCPENAFVEDKSSETGETMTRVIKDLCHGCTICMKECSFNKREYAQIKSKFQNLKNRII
ncbi:MAG: epoxyqueuosine reductase [Methanobacterium sp.]|nr:epoxyqueuosine reductase [Methanobacterium sp.]